MNEWIKAELCSCSGLDVRVILIYLCPDSLCDSFRKPVTFFLTREWVRPVFSPCDLFARRQQIRVSCGELLWRECLRNVRRIPPARIAFTHFHSCVQDFTLVVFLGHAAGIKLQMFDLTRGAYGVYVCMCVYLCVCVCVCVCMCVDFPLCLLPCEPLAVQPSSHSQLWLFPERRAR